MTAPHTSGTITLVKGSADVTGIDTGWAAALIVGGVLFVNVANVGAFSLPIKTVDSNTKITAAIPWNGANGTYTYALVRDGSYERQSVENAIKTATLLNEIRSLALTNLSTLTPAADKVPYFGPGGAAALADFNAAARALLAGGVLPNAQLPSRLQGSGLVITNANNFKDNGWAFGNNATGAPTNTGDGDWWTYENNIVAQAWGSQVATNYFSDRRRMRYLRDSVWQPWFVLNDERGSNANGEFTRFADGTQKCWGSVVTSYFNGAELTGSRTFPSAFSSTPTAVISASLIWPSGTSRSAPMWVRTNGINTTSINASATNPANNNVSGDQFLVYFEAVGRWY